jgi:hypothetical protein
MKVQVLLLLLLDIYSSIFALSNNIQSVKSLKIKAPFIISSLISSLIVNPSISMAEFVAAPWSPNIRYEVVKSAPNADVPKVGDIVRMVISQYFR